MTGRGDASRRPTLKDVARISGVSVATVSFVLNEVSSQRISEPTQERVRRAAEELGYRPHRIARALREGTSRLVVLDCTGLPRGGRGVASFIEGMEAELSAAGFAMHVRYSAGEAAERALADLAPHTVLDLGRAYGPGSPGLGDGGWSGGLAAHSTVQLGHLARQGHSRIAFALPPPRGMERFARLRTRHVQEAAARLGMAPVVELRLGAGQVPAEAVRRLREHHPEVSAVACFDDASAMRVLGAMAALGLVAPRDLAVIGFDESEFAGLWRPALTTVRIDGESYGRQAARAIIGGEPHDPPAALSRVVRRESA